MSSYTRRIQLTGGSTYIISLPSKWIRENRLEKGSELTIDDANGNLILSHGDREKTELVKQINVESKVDLENFQRVLTSAYISDFDSLVIKSSQYIDHKLRETVKKFSRLVMGVEIFEESSRTIVLQNVLDPASFPMSNAVRRMSLNVETMILDVIKGIEENDRRLLESVISRDDDVDRYELYVYRVVNKRKAESDNSIFYLIFSRILERIADHAVNICKLWLAASDNTEVSTKSISNYLNEASKLYNEAVEAYYARRFEPLNAIISRKPDFITMKHELIGEEKESSTLSSISEEILRVALYSTDIAELAMDLILGGHQEFTVRS